eukprot:790334-Prymnesium_polylepis.1
MGSARRPTRRGPEAGGRGRGSGRCGRGARRGGVCGVCGVVRRVAACCGVCGGARVDSNTIGLASSSSSLELSDEATERDVRLGGARGRPRRPQVARPQEKTRPAAMEGEGR